MLGFLKLHAHAYILLQVIIFCKSCAFESKSSEKKDCHHAKKNCEEGSTPASAVCIHYCLFRNSDQ